MKRIEDLNGYNDEIAPGTRCEVRRRYDNTFAKGFEVAELMPDGYRVRRLSDGSVLPAVFNPDDVQKERRP